jgi:hypothetical protein
MMASNKTNPSAVMAGHSRSKNGVASLAYDPAIHAFLPTVAKTWMPGTSPGMTISVKVPAS